MNRDQAGSVTPLIIGLAFVVALLVAVVVDASAGYLRREGLNATADAAALAAAGGVQAEQVYLGGLGPELRVDLASAERSVAAYLQDSGAKRRYEDLRWAVSVQGRYVVVRLRSSMRLPLRVPGTASRVTISASSSAIVTVAQW